MKIDFSFTNWNKKYSPVIKKNRKQSNEYNMHNTNIRKVNFKNTSIKQSKQEPILKKCTKS